MEHDILTVLSTTTGRLLTTPNSQTNNGIGKLKTLMSIFAGHDINTVEMLSVGPKVKGILLERHPELNIDVTSYIEKYIRQGGAPDFDGMRSEIMQNHGLPATLFITK